MDAEDALFTKLRVSRAAFESDPGQAWFTSGWLIRSICINISSVQGWVKEPL